jgi:SAM-dependent methyltransferase
MSNKIIHRSEGSTTIFDNRTLQSDYRTLVPVLRSGMHVLDVGCGTGAISKGIAEVVFPGTVTGIDNTEKFIISGREAYAQQANLTLEHADLFSFKPNRTYNLIVAARVLQWLNNPLEALQVMKSLLAPGGIISVLDYDHEAIEWEPAPPPSMQRFYNAFLKWRADVGMNNHIALDLPGLFEQAGLNSIESHQANELTSHRQRDFKERTSIWQKVASSTQMVDEGYIDNEARLQAINDYQVWIDKEGRTMTLKLSETRGCL